MWSEIIILGMGIGLLIWMRYWIVKIPATPPHYALLTLFGARVEKIKKEGLRVIWGRPWICNYILVNIVTKKIMISLEVRARDLAEAIVPIDVEFQPAEEGGFLISYLNREGEAGIKKDLSDIIGERYREWIWAPEGPRNSEELLGTREAGIYLLLRTIAGREAFPKIESMVPSPILMFKYSLKKMLTPYEFKMWGNKKWQDVRELWVKKQQEGVKAEEAWEIIWDDLEDHEKWKKIEDQLGKEQKAEIEGSVKGRLGILQKVREGRGDLKIEAFGIVLMRINVGEIKILGKPSEAMEDRAKEEQERRNEVFETETDVIKARMLVAESEKTKTPLSFNESYQIVMEWKTAREGKGYTIPGLPRSLIEMVQRVFGDNSGRR